MGEFLSFLGENIQEFLTYTGFANITMGNFIMIIVGCFFIYLAIAKEFEPMLLIPIGFGILIGNIPFKDAGLQLGIYEEGSVLNILYQGVVQGWYPPLIFLGIGAMTDFSALISNPKLMLIGAAAQFGIFGAYAIAAHYALIDDQERASYPHASAACCFADRENNFSHCRAVAYMFPCAVGSSVVGNAFLRELIERKWRYPSFGRDCPWPAYRCHHYFAGSNSRSLDTGVSVPDR